MFWNLFFLWTAVEATVFVLFYLPLPRVVERVLASLLQRFLTFYVLVGVLALDALLLFETALSLSGQIAREKSLSGAEEKHADYVTLQIERGKRWRSERNLYLILLSVAITLALYRVRQLLIRIRNLELDVDARAKQQ